MRIFIFCTHPQYHQADEVNDNELSMAYVTHGIKEKVVQGFGGNFRRKETSCKTEA
jgi:hypothetical protein